MKKCSNCYHGDNGKTRCIAGHSRLFTLLDVETKCKDWHQRVSCKCIELKGRCKCYQEFPARNDAHVFCSHACRSHWWQEQARKKRTPALRGINSLLGVLLQVHMSKQEMTREQIDQNFKEHGLHW